MVRDRKAVGMQSSVNDFHLSGILDSPIMLSFPHFYLADDSFRIAVDGISPPEKEKHQLFIDVQPVSLLYFR